jgi:hypothetical protein
LGLTWDNETIKQVFDLMIRTPIVDPYLRRRNAIHRFNLRQIEKNRFPVKCGCVVCGEGFLCGNIEDYLKRQYYLGPDKAGNIRHVCWGCDLTHKVRVAAGTLYNLVCAIPVSERDRQEIYPAEFRHPPWFPDSLPEKMRLPGLGLRDYAGPSKFGIRQQAASLVRNVLTLLVGIPAIDTRWALYLLAPETQQVLKRIGRLYKNSCWWSKKGPHRLFDKAEASSWKKAQLWKPGKYSVDDDFEPKDERLMSFGNLYKPRVKAATFLWDSAAPGISHFGSARISATPILPARGRLIIRRGTLTAAIPNSAEGYGRGAVSISRQKQSKCGTL